VQAAAGRQNAPNQQQRGLQQQQQQQPQQPQLEEQNQEQEQEQLDQEQEQQDQEQEQQDQLQEGQSGEEEEGSEAVLQAKQAKAEEDLVTAEFTEEIELKPLTFQSVAEDAQVWVRTTNLGKTAAGGVVAVLLGTLAIALYRTYQQTQTERNLRLRQVNRNKDLVLELAKVIPGHREKLTSTFIRTLRWRLGFTAVELFRKYLWFLLRERKFEQGAVEDLVALKKAAGLSDTDVAEALKERADRIYDKYGTLMLNTEGMTAAGIERKASCQALFRKMLYLTEYEPLLAPGSDAAAKVDLREIFGATEEDLDGLRIVSLHSIDLEAAFSQVVVDDDEDDKDAGSTSAKGGVPQ